MSFWRVFVTAALISGFCQLASSSEDFAIKTQVSSPSRDQSATENLTVFHGQWIYDFGLTRPRTVTVFDTKSREFILAQVDRRVLTSISADQLIRFAATEQARALGAANELVKFAADPKFDEVIDIPNGRCSLTSPIWDYHVDLQREDDGELLKRYGEFANWFTYLNGLFRPLPPAVRLKLNHVLDNHNCLPKRVVVRIKRDGKVVIEQQSRHQLIRSLGKDELDQVEVWEADRPNYRSVDFADYRAAVLGKTEKR